MPIATLLSLPPEVLHDIHLLSTSEHLPIVCTTLLTIYTHTTSPRYKAIFLWRKYLLKGNRKSLDQEPWDLIVSNQCCTIEVLRILQKFHEDDVRCLESGRNRIRIKQIPTRLFKAMSQVGPAESVSQTHLDELGKAYEYIKLLLTEFQASPDKLGGYPLARSVLSRNLRFVRLLLDHGARPSIKNNLVIMVAIGTGDLRIVRLLVEPNYRHPQEIEIEPSSDAPQPPKSKASSHLQKKIKLEDRVKITDQMLEKAIKRKNSEMAQYFMERGARPTLETIRFIETL